ncbi:hypothetical protein V6N12_062191 [Hibiscus sabdariffa]|uniref:Uncharacterized protein n=1 Tax=Hibiscus sabdariffa TaxID=183260 RepID=A0ABR2F852_9ROSI
MASRVDALWAIARLDGFILYGSRVRVSFAAQDTHDSFWRRKRGSLPRLPDPLHGDVVVDEGTMRTDRVVRSRRSVEGIVDVEKLSVLQTCATWWLKEATSIRVLAQEMAIVGLHGFELIWIMGSMVLISFLTMDLRDGLLASMDVWLAWFGRLEAWSHTVTHDSCRAWILSSGLLIHLWLEGTSRNIAGLWGCYLRVDAATEKPSSFERARAVVILEAELVWVPVVEHREEEFESEMGITLTRGVWLHLSLMCRAIEGHARYLDVVVGYAGASVASDHPVGCRGGVCSEGDVATAIVGDQSRVYMDVIRS